MRDSRGIRIRIGTLGALLALLAAPLHAATITIINNDGLNEGFNDPAAVAPVGGNPGITLGQQRLNVFQRAADIWGSILPGGITIQVRAQFDPIVNPPCTATSGVLGSAGALALFRDFLNAPTPFTWYVVSEANQLRGVDLDVANPDIQATFNSDVDNATCLGASNWYYGFDSNEGTNIELLPVVIHELGHGLGFTSQVNLSTGVFPGVPAEPTAYARFLLDNSTGKHWDIMTDGERVTSAVNNGNVVWDGPAVTASVPGFQTRQPRVTITAPAPAVGNYVGGYATFGAPLSIPGVSAPVLLAADGVVGGTGGTVNDACEALTNAAQMPGKIALVDRGLCSFAAKAAAVQAVGAVGIIIVNNAAGAAPSMSGTDPSVTIPVVSVSQADGATLKANLAGLTATITTHPTQFNGADAAGRMRVFAPNPLQLGSSISHWDVVAFPNLLMEPALGADLIGVVDITREQMRDIGWFSLTSITGVPPGPRVTVQLHSAPNPFGNSTAVHFELSKAGPAELDVFTVDGRHLRTLLTGNLPAGAHSVTWNGFDEAGRRAPAGVYLFRLHTDDFTASGRTVRLD